MFKANQMLDGIEIDNSKSIFNQKIAIGKFFKNNSENNSSFSKYNNKDKIYSDE